MLFLERCPDIAYRKLCQLLSARVHTIVCLWICLRGVEAVRNLANGCIIFGTVAPSLQRASLKSVGSLHPAPSHPPTPAQTLGVGPSVAQLGSLTAAKAAAQNLLDLWPVHGPAPTALHYTTHRWLDHLLEITVTGVQQVFLGVGGGGIPPSPGKQQSDSAAGLPCSCLCSKIILRMCHRLTINCSGYSTPRNPGMNVFFFLFSF